LADDQQSLGATSAHDAAVQYAGSVIGPVTIVPVRICNGDDGVSAHQVTSNTHDATPDAASSKSELFDPSRRSHYERP